MTRKNKGVSKNFGSILEKCLKKIRALFHFELEYVVLRLKTEKIKFTASWQF